jgi:glycosyltransferase involved in cell wall biosynthesis
MRIAFNGSFWPMETTGSGQYLRQLVPALWQLAPSEEYILFVPRYVSPRAPVVPPWLVVEVVPTPWDHMHPNLAKLWFEQVAFPRACRKAAVDLAHVPYFAPPLSPSVPTVTTVHDLIPMLLPAYRGSPLVRGYTRLAARAARRAPMVLTDSLASARDIERLLDIPSSRVRAIYLAAGPTYRPMSPDEWQPTLARLGIPTPYVLYLGGLDVRKNVTNLLRAWWLVREPLADITLVIAGRLPDQDTPFTPDPRRIAAELGIEDVVHYTGWVAEEDKPALYAGALAFAFPSHYEGFGLPVLESLACGTPAVVGGGSSLEEIVGPGGLIVPPHDIDALARALVELTRRPDRRAEFARRGLEHASTFAWEETARRTWQAYHEVLERGNRP